MSLKYLSAPSKTLAESITASATSFKLNNIQGWDGNNLTASDFGTEAFGVIRNANNTIIELIEFDPATIADASITILKRGLEFTGDLTTEVTAHQLAWTKGDTFIDLGLDTPQMLQWIQEYVDAAIAAGGVPATDAAAGIVKTATPALFDAGTDTDGTYKYVTPVGLLNSRTYIVDSGAADAYVITPSPAIASYVAGQTFTFKATNANTGTSTLNVNALGTKTIIRGDGSIMLSGNILADQLITVVYDGTDFMVVSELSPALPTIQTYTTTSTVIGDSTTQFDVTNPAGSTFRYTWDTTGTDPGLTGSNPNVGDGITILDTNLATGNEGSFIVTGSGIDYFEVDNSGGTVETNKTISTGEISITLAANLWTKPDGLTHIIIEVQGGGAGGGGEGGNGGAGGAYAKKLLSASELATTEVPSIAASVANAVDGEKTTFSVSNGTQIISNGGTAAGVGGTATGGDVNIDGEDGGGTTDISTNVGGAKGGSSQLGFGGAITNNNLGSSGGGSAGNNGKIYGGGGGAAEAGNGGVFDGGTGAQGVIIVTEYYS